LAASGQLKVALGNSCVVAVGGGLAVQDCDAAARSIDARDKFISIAVPELDVSTANAARAAASLALNTASRLAGIGADLKLAVAKLEDCGGANSRHGAANRPEPLPSTSLAHEYSLLRSSRSSMQYEPSLIAAIASGLGVDGVGSIIEETRATIAALRSQL